MKPCISLFGFMLLIFFLTACEDQPELVGQQKDTHWYKGNLHTHSLWSDGDDYPEMIMDWYQSNGYHFIGLSDHNILQQVEENFAILTTTQNIQNK